MAEFKLNKPLYETEDSKRYEQAKNSPSNKQATPPDPQPGMWGRLGAFGIDILLIHCVLQAVAVFGHDLVIQLGFFGRWVGLLVGFAYFSVGYSALTGGRTLGKAILRLHVCDAQGPDALLPRAMGRALGVLWPFAVYIVLGYYAEKADMDPNMIGWQINCWTVGLGLIVAYGLSNTLFASLDSCGRSLYDYVSGTAQFCDAATSADQQKMFRQIAGQSLGAKQTKRIAAVVVLVVVLIPGLIGWVLYRNEERLAAGSAEDIELLREYRNAVYVPEFRFAGAGEKPEKEDVATSGTVAAADEPTSVTTFLMLARGPVDRASLEKNPKVLDMPATQGKYFETSLKRSLAARSTDEAKRMREALPRKLNIRVEFAELSDLFFAWNTSEVFAVTQGVELNLDEPSVDDTTTSESNVRRVE